ncbi:MAG: response regulator [Nannocystaceae bacterium]|nr:response regulator [Nannocystaceae bacterium]
MLGSVGSCTESRRIVVLESERGVADDLKQVLLLAEFRVTLTQTAAHAAIVLQTSRFDVFLADADTAQQGGSDPIAQARLRHVRVVLMTRDGQAPQHCDPAGVAEFLVRPFSFNALLRRVARRSRQPSDHTNVFD